MSWKTSKLSELCDIDIGKTPSRSNFDYWNGNLQWVSISDMKGKFIKHTKECITEKGVKETNCKIVPANTLLMSFKLSIGKLAFTTEPIYTNEAIAALKVKDCNVISNNYLYYALQMMDLTKGSEKAVKGLTLNKAKLNELKITYPSIDQQQKIVDILNKADEIRTKKRLANDKLDELLKSTFISIFGDPVKNTKGYSTDLLKNISTIISGGTPSRQHSEYFGGHIPWVTTVALGNNYIDKEDAQDYLTELGVEKSATHIIPKNSLLFGSRVGVGKTSVNLCDICTNQDILSITNIDSGKFNMIYIKKVLEQYTAYFANQKRGATIKGISADVLRNINIPFAPIDLQNKYLEIVNKVEKQKQKNEQVIEQMDNLFNSLSQKVFRR